MDEKKETSDLEGIASTACVVSPTRAELYEQLKGSLTAAVESAYLKAQQLVDQMNSRALSTEYKTSKGALTVGKSDRQPKENHVVGEIILCDVDESGKKIPHNYSKIGYLQGQTSAKTPCLYFKHTLEEGAFDREFDSPAPLADAALDALLHGKNSCFLQYISDIHVALDDATKMVAEDHVGAKQVLDGFKF